MNLKLIFIVLSCLTSFVVRADEIVGEVVGSWTNVVSFCISQDGDYVVMSMRESDGTERAYESLKSGNQWGAPLPIESINSKCEGVQNVGGVFLNYEENKIYYHANYSDGMGGYDIWSVSKTADGWGEPVREDELCSLEDDTYPTMSSGEYVVYLLRHQAVADMKEEQKSLDKMSVWFAYKNSKGKWEKLQPSHHCIAGYIQDVNVARDGRTVYYTSREARKEQSILYTTYSLMPNTWYLPSEVLNDESGIDWYSLQCSGDRLYAIQANNKKHDRVGSIVSMPQTKETTPRATVVEDQHIVTLEGKKPISVVATVYDPTTMGVLGKYESSDFDGRNKMTNLALPSYGEYIVDYRDPNYSYAIYQIKYDELSAQLPQTVELFDTVELQISVYDSEIFRPLDSKVIAVRSTDKAIFRSVRVDDGKYLFRFPLGSNYNIIANSKGFAENKFLFRLAGDIVFSHFERELPLDPGKTEVKIRLLDSDTKELLNGDVVFKNLVRDEELTLPSEEMSGGKHSILLRSLDKYDVTISGVNEHAFYNGVFEVEKLGDNTLTIELTPLVVGTRVRLNNINFATASADLRAESYVELDRLVLLMNENPDLKVEISAHTDNVGSGAYNMKLSDRRAASVTTYLVESGISEDRLISRGYGMSKPSVPNDSEENRAINRRVEFLVR